MGAMNIVNFEYYKVFYYTAKFGTISRAAEALFVTQPSITKGIQKLESQLGCTLFTRTSRGMTLTDEGRILFERVGPACEAIINAEEEIYRLKHLDAGTVRLNSVTTVLDSILIPDIADFTAVNQSVNFEIVKHELAYVVKDLEDGALDFSLDYEDMLYEGLPLFKARNLEPEVWAGRVIEMAAVVGEKYRSLVSHSMSSQEIAEYPLILKAIPKELENRDFYHAIFRSGANRDKKVFIGNTLDIRVAMAKNNMGITFVPLDCVYDLVEAGKLFVLNYDGMLPQKRLVVFRNARKTLSIAAQEFLDYLIDREELERIPFPRPEQ